MKNKEGLQDQLEIYSEKARLLFYTTFKKATRRHSGLEKFTKGYIEQQKRANKLKKKILYKVSKFKKKIKTWDLLNNNYVKETDLKNDFQKNETNFFGRSFIKKKSKSRKYHRKKKRGNSAILIKDNVDTNFLKVEQNNECFNNYFQIQQKNNTNRIYKLTLLKILNANQTKI